jgi:hypothetical protein
MKIPHKEDQVTERLKQSTKARLPIPRLRPDVEQKEEPRAPSATQITAVVSNEYGVSMELAGLWLRTLFGGARS